MRNEILANINNPLQLERLYRSNKTSFRQAFASVYSEVKDSTIASFWDARLNFTKDEISWGTRKQLLFITAACIVAGIIAKIPAFVDIEPDFFYSRNISFIVLPILMAYFSIKNSLSTGKSVLIIALTLAAFIYINALPDVPKSDTLLLAAVHLPFLLWSLVGFAFVGSSKNDVPKRVAYLNYNGDLIVMTTIIVIAGVVLSAVTINLFSFMGFKIEEFYFTNIAAFLLPSAPILATHLTQANPNLVGKVSPVIARIFSPLVLVMLAIYLGAMVYAKKDPYNDREFLMLFNALLIGVMVIIFFSVAALSRSTRTTTETWILFCLSALTIVVNSIALSAIVFRIVEFGISPNRLAVLGSNALILINLLLVAVQLFKAGIRRTGVDRVDDVISTYLPVYFVWAMVVVFVFPLMFAFK